MTRPDIRIILAAALLAMLVACSRQSESSMAAADMAASAPVVEETMPALPPPEAAGGADARAFEAADVQKAGVDAAQVASSAADPSSSAGDPRRRFVRTADARFQVKDVYGSTLAIEDAAAAEGGFVVRNAITTNEHGRIERSIGDGKRLQLSEVVTEGSMVVRVPSERTQEFLRTVAKQMAFLDARTFEANDVQFDLLRRELAQARAQALQQDIRSVAAQPGKTGEKVDAVQARAEMLAARDDAVVAQRELEDRIAYSTLTLHLRQPAQVREQVVPDTQAILRERGPGFFNEVGEALRAGWRGFLALVVALVHLWPAWVAFAIVAWGLLALRRQRRGAMPTSVPKDQANG